MLNSLTEEKLEAGKEILSYCGKCKEDSCHVISAVDNDKIGKVMCRTCGALHNYRKPKSLIKDKAAKKTTKSAKSATPRKTRKSKKWNDLIENCDLNDAQDYSMEKNFEESSIIRHPSFGVCVVTKKIDQNKIEVLFEAGPKLLVINRN